MWFIIYEENEYKKFITWEVDSVLTEQFQKMYAKNITINGTVIQEESLNYI
jgi:hypothetical protein